METFWSDIQAGLNDAKSWFTGLFSGPAGGSRTRTIVGGLTVAVVLAFLLFPLLRKVPYLKKAIPR